MHFLCLYSTDFHSLLFASTAFSDDTEGSGSSDSSLVIFENFL